MERLATYLTKQQGPNKQGLNKHGLNKQGAAKQAKTSKNSSRRELAYERIKDAIRHSALEPGEPLTETRLSKLLGISRTPVREALQQLVQEGLAEATPGHAVTVATRTVQDVLDVVHIRSLLEPEQVRLATEVVSVKQVEVLESTMQEMERAAQKNDLAAWSKADAVFHDVLKEACPNKLLAETVVQLKNRVHHMANLDTQINADRLLACTKEHRTVVSAVKAKDPKAAKAAMEDHIAALTNSLLKRISYR
jgi:DNA-binding GntR family transcriptional regulator